MVDFEDVIHRKSVLPDRWVEDKVEPPTDEAKKLSVKLCKCLWKHGILPARVTPTVEGGMYIEYYKTGTESFPFERSMSFEVYNDLTIVVIVNDEVHKYTLYSSDIKDLDVKQTLEVFSSGVVTP